MEPEAAAPDVNLTHSPRLSGRLVCDRCGHEVVAPPQDVRAYTEGGVWPRCCHVAMRFVGQRVRR